MSVSNYLAKSNNGCRYAYDKLKHVVYLVSASHLKKVYIDNGEAYISGLTESPLKIEGFNIEFKEDTSLDERYKFQKSLTISVSGFSTFKDFNNKYYAIIQTIDGTFYMVNVDFPSKVTHTYNLSKNVNQTDFTLSSVSNFPALKLNGFNPSESFVCKSYQVNGIDGLRMLEQVKTKISTSENKIYSTEAFKIVEYLGESLVFQETYDGEKFETRVEFQIAFDAYKSSWHYNLLEFVLNEYAAIIGIKNSNNKIYAGFYNGLEPNYSIQASTEQGQSDIITITLVGISNNGSVYGNYTEIIDSSTSWIYIDHINDKKAYVCLYEGTAMYLLKQEINAFGNPTGNYKVFVGYESWFPELNIIGTFETQATFYSSECTGDNNDEITTDIPSTLIYNGGTADTCNGIDNCFTFSILSNKNWQIVEMPAFLSTNITNGNANTDYDITLCNAASPNDFQTVEGTLTIKYGLSYYVVDVKVLRLRYKWKESSFYYCSNGGKYVAEFQYESKDGGHNYIENGVTRLGRLVENNSSFCNSAVTYEWRETDNWMCDGGEEPTPSGCTAFIVDGGHVDVKASGATGCDSAFLYIDGTPIFYENGSSAATCDWITINLYHWDEDDISHFCTWYNYYPCVANNLMYLADLVPSSANCQTASSRIGDYPEIVQDAINKTGEYAHALGTIEYVVAPNSGSARSCTIKWFVDSEECPSAEYIVNQASGSSEPVTTCVCNTFDVRGQGVTVSSAITSNEYLIAKYTGATNCSESLTITKESGVGFLGNFRVSNGNIYAKVISANTYSARQDKYKVTQADCEGYIYVNQTNGYVPPSSDKFEWLWAGHEQSYSATVEGNSTYINLIQFDSSKNGSYVNATLSANTSWIITNNSSYINNNELAPNINNFVYVQPNETSSARTGTLVLTQKGTSNKIYCYVTQGAYQADCTITAFTISSSVKQGENIRYSFGVADTRCNQTFYFTIYDSNDTPFSFNASPVCGTTSGTISSSGMSLGNAVVNVTVNSSPRNYYINIKPLDITCKFIMHNNVLGHEVYPNHIYINKAGSGTIDLNIGHNAVTVNGSVPFTKELMYALDNYTFDSITIGDTWVNNKTYRTTYGTGTFTDGGTYHLYITGEIS